MEDSISTLKEENSVKRDDGRKFDDIRTLNMKTGLLSKSNGSCEFSLQGTTVLVSVKGPDLPSSSKKAIYDRANIEVIFRGTQSVSSSVTLSEERELEAVIRGILEQVCQLDLFPRTIISVNAQVISLDGSLLTCAVMAAISATIDAGIPMMKVPSCCNCGVIREDGKSKYLIDLNSKEEVKCAGRLFLCALGEENPRVDESKTILSLVLDGNLSTEELKQCINLCRSGSVSIRAFISLSFRKNLEKNSRKETVKVEQNGES